MVTICENHLQMINDEKYSEKEMTELECQGKSPWEDGHVPEGVWAWSEQDNEVLVGYGYLKIVTYDDAREYYSDDVGE